MTQQEERFSVGLFVAERLRELRLDRKLSQPELEQRTGVARTYISRVENGHVTPSLEMLGRLAKGLQVPLACFTMATNHQSQHLERRRHSAL